MRDDFAKRTIDILAKRVNYRCSNLNCRKPTSGPREDPTKAVNIGVAAHITAAAPGGPRYDPTLTSKQHSSIDNGIWLRQNCAKLVDNDPDRYPADVRRPGGNRASTLQRRPGRHLLLHALPLKVDKSGVRLHNQYQFRILVKVLGSALQLKPVGFRTNLRVL